LSPTNGFDKTRPGEALMKNTSSSKIQFLALAFSCSVASACAGADGSVDEDEAALLRAPHLAQMNDLTILFPLPKNTQEAVRGQLAASASGSRGALLPLRLYVDATGELETEPPGHLQPGQDRGQAHSALRVVAMRIDPCFANIGPVVDDDKCKNQVRLVFQAVNFSGSSGYAVDGAVHAFYTLTRTELLDLTQAVVALRRSQSGNRNLGPLAQHPTLVTQGLLGAEGSGLRALILQYAGQRNLTRFTVFSPGNLATQWNFSGFDVTQGRTNAMAVPELVATSNAVSFFAGFSARELTGKFAPATKSADNMQLLGNKQEAQNATAPARQAAFDAALRIENPDHHSPDTIDCASCHVAGPGRVVTGGAFGLSERGNVNAFARNKKAVAASEMTQTTPVNAKSMTNLHMLSYRFEQPMISTRVINETASVLAYVNNKLLPAR
jgi:hypothetical protein